MRPILCVVDLSESSVKVLEVAARMANANKTHLTILFPYRLISYAYKEDISKLKGKLEQEAREKFSVIQKQVEVLNNIFFEFQPEIGFAVDRINSYVRQNKVDMIVISQSQANAINEVNIMALQNLITSSKTPFTIVPAEINAEISSH
jgi:nucleotide-binding universal stress UspA family protein